ncbi:MAG: hypothetical protein KBS96_03600 [Lachnospiraceae bacterium]|nr:hypothetical protein [Candidatus Colinaster scatohippi]
MIISNTKRLNETDVYSAAITRLKELEKMQKILIDGLNKAPEGKILIANKHGNIQFFLRKSATEKTGKYIRKNQIDKIRTYIQKSYNEKVLKLITKEIENLETFLSNSEESITRIQELYSKNPQEIKNNIKPIDMSDQDYADEWRQESFEGKPPIEGETTYKTDNGEIVRSKSELNIANALYKAGIPYKYECPVWLMDGTKIHPDFTVLNVRERRVKYWEHRGMMDDRNYAKHSVSRLKEMGKSGIIVGDNLIITEETSTIGLGTDEITRIIDHFFR